MERKYAYILLGGMVGAVARFAIQQGWTLWAGNRFPWGTLFINVVGSFIYVLVISLAVGRWKDEITAGVTVGFLGAFTTFSSFCGEAVSLLQEQHFVAATLYLAGAPLLGLAAAAAGMPAARALRKICSGGEKT